MKIITGFLKETRQSANVFQRRLCKKKEDTSVELLVVQCSQLVTVKEQHEDYNWLFSEEKKN